MIRKTEKQKVLDASRRESRAREFRERAAKPVVRRSGGPQTIEEFVAAGGVIEVLPPFAMSGHEVDDDEDE